MNYVIYMSVLIMINVISYLRYVNFERMSCIEDHLRHILCLCIKSTDFKNANAVKIESRTTFM